MSTTWTRWSQQILEHLVRWTTRRRHGGRVLLKTGAMIVIATFAGGYSLQVKHQATLGSWTAWLSTGEGLPLEMLRVAFWLGTVLIAIGTLWMCVNATDGRRNASRATIIAVELRGLVDTSDTPLNAAIPRRLPGARLSILLDLRPQARAGAAEAALQELLRLPDLLRLTRVDRPRELTQLVVGGVVQVPFLFAAGMLLDDEGTIFSMDWDRQGSRWRELDEPDDGERFEVRGLESLPENSPRILVAISASYSVDRRAISETFSGLPMVTLSLPDPRPNVLWSAEKQAALSQQFLELMAMLANRAVARVDLVLAAPASLALRLGRAYDLRNMSSVYCYQYQKDHAPPYPWSVSASLGEPLRLTYTPSK